MLRLLQFLLVITLLKWHSLVRKIKLTIKDVTDGRHYIPIKVPSNKRLPKEDGEFVFTAEETGQNYGVEGIVETERTQSDTTRTTESCTYYETRRECSGLLKDS